MLPVVAGEVAGSVATGIFSAREAQKNREFQERMSSTAHQRGVADLKKAGLNPLLVMGGGSASTPPGALAQMPDLGGSVGRGISSALATRKIQSEINLLDAQTAAANAAGQESNVRAGDILATKAGRVSLVTADAAIANRNFEQMKEMFPIALENAKAEVESKLSSAQSMRVRTMLDRLGTPGAVNEADFQRAIGQLGPWGRVVGSMFKLGIAGAAAGAVLKSAGKKRLIRR